MNTSFSKYVKQCKWGLSLDTAGSDYSAHQLARLLTTILGRLPGPRARRWEESPVPPRSSRTRAPGIPAGGDWRASAGGWGAGGWDGPLTLYVPPGEDVPGGVAVGGWGGAAGPARSHPHPWHWDTRESRLREKNLNSGQTPRQGLESHDFLGDQNQRSGGSGKATGGSRLSRRRGGGGRSLADASRQPKAQTCAMQTPGPPSARDSPAGSLLN